MTIKTYRFLGDPRKVDKTLTAVKTYSNAVIVGDMRIQDRYIVQYSICGKTTKQVHVSITG